MAACLERGFQESDLLVEGESPFPLSLLEYAAKASAKHYLLEAERESS